MPELAYAVLDDAAKLLRDRPEWRRNLEEMVQWETLHPPGKAQPGWEWTDVHTHPSILATMVATGIVDVPYHSRGSTSYRLRDRAAVEEALAVEDPTTLGAGEPIDTADLFRHVIGHERVKALLRYGIAAADPVHFLIAGEPGSAKSLLLADIGRLPGAHFYLGSTTSKAGLVSLLLQERPAYLVLDEIEKTDSPRDLDPLLSLMQSGIVYRLQQGRREQVQMQTKVFAACNDKRRIAPALLSRFALAEIPPYNPAEFLKVASAVLQDLESVGPAVAELIATKVVVNSLDIRDAVRVARLARGDPHRVVEIVGYLWPGEAAATVARLVPRAAR